MASDAAKPASYEAKPAAETTKPVKSKAQPNSFGLLVGKSATKDYFDFAACFEPLCAEGKEADGTRLEAFKSADPNGNGLCSLAELETFVLSRLLGMYPNKGKGKELKTPGKDLFSSFRPCYIRAFTDAKDYKAHSGAVIKGTQKATDDDFVSKEEFKLFCTYVIVYGAMFDAFSKIDGGAIASGGASKSSDSDRRITEEEWLRSFKTVADHGFVALEGLADKKAAKKVFSAIDDNGGGIVLLDEWCWYLKQAEVKADTPVGKLLVLDESGGVGKPEKLVAAKAKVVSKATPTKQKMARVPSREEKEAANAKDTPLPPMLAAKIRFRETCGLEVKENRNKTEEGKEGPELSAAAFSALVRLLMTEGGVAEMPNDADMKAAFVLADENKSGTIDEGEFAKLYHLVLKGQVGGLGKKGSFFFGASASVKKQRGEFQDTFKDLGEFDDKTGKLKPKPKPRDPVPPNSVGLCVRKLDSSGGGGSASEAYFLLESCFAPLCDTSASPLAASPPQRALLQEAFKSADPNRNGLCSLAELDTFVLSRLLGMYPNKGKGKELKTPGKDVHAYFRPCLVRAFHDAKDFKADSGAILEGTKKATDDDFVSKEEFKLFCTYVIVYGAMFDAFSKIDGGASGAASGGSSKSSDSDRRITEEEWLRSFKAVADHGFVALEGVETQKQAKAAFAEIDDNGGGIVLLDEWCWYLKQAEVKANTAVGQLLALDEAGGMGMKEKLAAGKAKVVSKANIEAKRRASSAAQEAKKLEDEDGAKAKEAKALIGAHISLASEDALGALGTTPGTAAASGSTMPSVERAKLRFRESCAVSGSGLGRGELGSSAFSFLVKELVKVGGAGSSKANPLPNDADVKAAFALADENKSGTIDEGEFAKLYHLVLKGQVGGLGKKGSFFFGASASQKKQRGEFQDTLKELAGSRLPGELISSEERTKLVARFQAAVSATAAAAATPAVDAATPPTTTGEGGMAGEGGVAAESVSGGKSLSKKAFKKLLKDVLTEETNGKKESLPTQEDMEEAFLLADADKNGTIDESEFAVIAAVYLAKHREAVEKAAQKRAEEKAKAEELKLQKIAEAREKVRKFKSESAESKSRSESASSFSKGGGRASTGGGAATNGEAAAAAAVGDGDRGGDVGGGGGKSVTRGSSYSRARGGGSSTSKKDPASPIGTAL